ncbi:MAG: hypothetical protein IKB15_00980 [Alistipes sp.]|nr:hypothetical protein [Alistipes sp.]
MNKRVKVAILGLLGLSTAACCGTKKANKSQDAEPQPIETDGVDPRIQLMYGVPFPDGEVVRPIEEESATADKGGVPFPDGAVVKPITEEEAEKRIEEMHKEKEQAQAESQE